MDLVGAEIARFLASSEPEVLCIRGRWGVGKTFAWKRYLQDAIATRRMAMRSYSYVSLFGINSLEDLRFAVFERTVAQDHAAEGADAETFQALLAKGANAGRKARPVLDLILPFSKGQSLAAALYRSAFLLVRDQLVCLDDLERAGPLLALRDVLGLASFLKEERRCKVVLLLNDERLGDQAIEFADQIEKVADVTMLFAPSAPEAAVIAVPGDDPLSVLLRERSVALNITNIRVIAKTARLARRLNDLLDELDWKVVDQAVSTLVLVSWSVQQPSAAPSISFLLKCNSVAFHMRQEESGLDAQEATWQAAIAEYPYRFSDGLDQAVIDGAMAGYFDDRRVRAEGAAAEERLRHNSRDSNFSRVWDELYHGSLSTDDGAFLDALRDAATREAAWISPTNINSAIYMLREGGRAGEAEALTHAYVAAHNHEPRGFFDMSNHHFVRNDQVEGLLRDAFARRYEDFVDPRDPIDIIRSLGERGGWERTDVAALTKCSADDFERMFEALDGKELKPSIQTLLSMGRSGEEGAAQIQRAAEEALVRIAGKSRLRARKVAAFGVHIDLARQTGR